VGRTPRPVHVDRTTEEPVDDGLPAGEGRCLEQPGRERRPAEQLVDVVRQHRQLVGVAATSQQPCVAQGARADAAGRDRRRPVPRGGFITLVVDQAHGHGAGPLEDGGP
jgi:hypothetical protein